MAACFPAAAPVHHGAPLDRTDRAGQQARSPVHLPVRSTPSSSERGERSSSRLIGALADLLGAAALGTLVIARSAHDVTWRSSDTIVIDDELYRASGVSRRTRARRAARR